VHTKLTRQTGVERIFLAVDVAQHTGALVRPWAHQPALPHGPTEQFQSDGDGSVPVHVQICGCAGSVEKFLINRLAPGQVISPSMDSLAGSSESNLWTLDDRGRLLHTWSIFLERNILSNQPVGEASEQESQICST
jgi:hypothetical protein